MMMDIFTSFDPKCYLTTSKELFLWLSPMLILWFVNSLIWYSKSNQLKLMSMLTKLMEKQIHQTFMKNIKFSMNLITLLFLLIIIKNSWGMIPYSFPTSSHLIFTLTISMPLWLAMILSSLMINFPKTIANILPSGAPNWLNPFLVIIEMISITVRPLTLAFRLAANMSAGHVVLTLISIYLTSSLFTSMTTSSLLMSMNIFYMMFELSICMIQAFIFCLLLTLYSDDHQTY